MKTTIIIPVKNEKDGIIEFLESVLNQTKKPDDIIVVDGFSTDGTAQILQNYEKSGKITLIQKESNIAQARNIAIHKANDGLILCTDAGSIIEKNRVEEYVKFFSSNPDVKIAGGLYKTIAENKIQNRIKPEFEIRIKDMKINFYPSSRNIAFFKEVREKVGGYPEYLSLCGEDTLFNYKAIEAGYEIHPVKTAIVNRYLRPDLKSTLKAYFMYAKGDGEIFGYHKILITSSAKLVFAISFAIFTSFLILIFAKFSLFLGLISIAVVASLFAGKVKGPLWFRSLFNFGRGFSILLGFVNGYQNAKRKGNKNFIKK